MHALDCNKGGLVTAHHNGLSDGVADLVIKSFNPKYMHGDPLIFVGPAVEIPKACPDGTTPFLS